MNRRRFIPAAMVIVVTVAAYLPILFNGFVLQDDLEWIEKNPRLNPPSIANLIECWQHPMQGLYVPVTYTLWSVLALIGTKPIVFHAASLLLHVISTLLILTILNGISSRPKSIPLSPVRRGEGRGEGLNDSLAHPAPHPASPPRTGERSAFLPELEDSRESCASQWPAVFGALLFALHPLQVESVAWASGMKDVLAGLLSLVMIDQYLRHIKSERDSRPWHLHYAAAIIALLLGLLAKPSAVMAPVVAGAIDVMLVRKNLRAAIERLWPTVLLIVPCIVLSREVQPAWPETFTPLWTRPLIAGDALAFYLMKLFWPFKLTAQYGRTPQSVVASHAVYYMWLIPVAAGILIALVCRRFYETCCGGVVFALGLLPILGFMPFMFQLNSTVADHYVYLAMLGPAIAVAGIIARAVQAKQIRMLTSSALALAALLVLSVFQEFHWKDSVALSTQAVLANPDNPTAHGQLGIALATAGDYREAAKHFRLVTIKTPDSPMAWIYLGRALEASHQTGEAYRELIKAAKRFPQDSTINAELQNLRHRLAPATTSR